jgi:hypothetical protein
METDLRDEYRKARHMPKRETGSGMNTRARDSRSLYFRKHGELSYSFSNEFRKYPARLPVSLYLRSRFISLSPPSLILLADGFPYAAFPGAAQGKL